MRINVVFPGNTNKPTGGYKILYEYCNKLVEYGHEITINYFYGTMFENLPLPNALRKVLVKIYSESIGPGMWFKLDKKIKKRVIDEKSEIPDGDFVIATAIETVDYVLSLSKGKGKKVYLIQDFENWACSDEKVYKTFNAGMINVVVSKWLYELVRAHSADTPYLVSNCINTAVFFNKGHQRVHHSIVMHYRSASHKGPEYAMETIRRLEGIYNDLTVDVISSEDSPQDLPKSCRFHHSIKAPEIADINNEAEIFLCTSIEEGFGLPGLEGMACGCALVSFSYRGVLEYAIDGKNALLSEVRNVDILVDNIVRLFEDKELLERISKEAEKTGQKKSLENSARLFEQILFEELKKDNLNEYA